MKILSAHQIYEADQATIKNKPISSIDLMEYAATQCFDWILNYLQDKNKTIHIFCGIGNNGGDGLVIARKLIQAHCDVKIFIVNLSKHRSDEFVLNYGRLIKLSPNICELNDDNEFPNISDNEFIIDALFGIGLSRSVEGLAKKIIQKINRSKAHIISIDLPSGMFTNHAIIDPNAVIMSTEVLTFQNPKLCLFMPENSPFIKKWHLMDIDLSQSFIDSMETNFYCSDKNFIQQFYKKRKIFSHKGSYGHSLIMGGSFGKIGAVSLASKAALKIGSGLVTAYVPKCGYEIVQTSIPEVMVEVDSSEQLEFFNYKSNPSVIGIGIGLGTSEKTTIGFGKFLQNNYLPLVIDADALNIMARNTKLLNLIPELSILTPHPKELERLVGKWANDYEKLKKLIEFSAKINCIVVLKGAFTMIAYNGKVYFNTTGNSGLATAGSGDILTGIITGLIAQKYKPIEAAIFGVYIHGRAADIAVSNENSMETLIASDVIKYFSNVFKELE